ncbi:DMT family transporter [Oculatella sp. LEGE 06141]|uniref:DMT family transporter n=1 Tax=Oculatella sp. LEGE 06141 TaxID=1828648 RepID=UPI00187DF56E|nr:DMT family transporter [Oculatella sp. LEGE 06141]MBE9180960.1 DMT family transporter [Oculatella sp. LEGE 06141]
MPLHQSSGHWRLGLTLALATASLWGVLPIALKVVLQAVDVYTVTWFRFLVSFGLLAIYLVGRGQFPSWQKLRSSRLDLLAIATLCLAVNYLFYLKGLDNTSPTNSQVIIQLAPVFMGLGGLAIFRERYTVPQWIGLGAMTAGMTLFFNDQLQALVNASTQYLVGTGILVLAALFWAVYALAQKQLLQQLSSTAIMLVIYGGSALLFSPSASPQQLLTLTPLQWGMLIFSGFNTFLAYGAFAEALDHWEASRVSAVLALTPIVTLTSIVVVSSVLPTLLAPEQITLLGIAGAALVVCGSLAISLGKNQAIAQSSFPE